MDPGGNGGACVQAEMFINIKQDASPRAYVFMQAIVWQDHVNFLD